MIILQVAQLIYTRVEPAYSPYQKDGFQTVYKSESLSSSDVSSIEKHVQCFQSYQPALVRRQFFTLPDERIVVASTIQIEAHPEIIDRSRRKGTFLAHCLIVDKAEFEKVHYNPFVIFDHFQFISDAENMVAIFGKATGKASMKDIKITRLSSILSCSWSGNEARKLVFLGLQAEQLSKDSRSVFLLGKEEDIDETLRVVFHLLPKNKRILCTFNTCIDGCSTQPGMYWAVGAGKLQGESSYIEVKTTERRIATQINDIFDHNDLYLNWLKAVSTREHLKTAIEQAPTIQVLSTAFTGRCQLTPDELNEEACGEFIRLYKNRVMSDLNVALIKVAGKKIAELLIDYIYQQTRLPILLGIAACQNIELKFLCSLAADYIFAEKPDLKNSEWRILQNLAQQAKNMFLLYLSATFGKNVDEEARDEALRRMDKEMFQKILELLMAPLEPAHFVTPAYLSLLLDNPRLGDMNDEQFIDLVTTIIKADASNSLDFLADYIEIIENKPLAQLEKLIKKQHVKIPRKFEAAIIARREELGNPLRVLRFFRR